MQEDQILYVQDLGRRHSGYGVLSQHYDPVGSALLKTLADGLEVDFDEETEVVWMIK